MPSSPLVKIVYLPNYAGNGPLRQATLGAVGYDLCSAKKTCLVPDECLVIPTGIKIALPYGLEAQIRPRSGLALRGITVLNSPGTIDPDYRGELGVILCNVTYNRTFYIGLGDRIAQLVFARYETPNLVDVVHEEELGATERGEGGFGSTDAVYVHGPLQ